MRIKLGFVGLCLTVPLLANAQQSSNPQREKTNGSPMVCPMHDSGSAAAMNERAEQGMGFSQTATTHHFLMKSDGGVIQVEVKNPADIADRDRIRQHLAHIAQAFGHGDFDIPMFVHDTLPPGVTDMKRLRQKMRYSFEETPGGGRVVIATADQQAITAIHRFLQFQIKKHKTGDPIEVR